MAKNTVIGFFAGIALTLLAVLTKVPLDLVFLIWQLIFAMSYWMSDDTYVVILQGYIGFLLFVIALSITALLRRRK